MKKVKGKHCADHKLVKLLDAIPWKERQWGHALAMPWTHELDCACDICKIQKGRHGCGGLYSKQAQFKAQ